MNLKTLIISLSVSGGLFFASVALGGSPTFISGSQSGTLYLTNSPYIVTGDIFMPPGGQMLTIEPGVVLQFTNDNIGAYIDGTLIARGTSGSPILFTSDKTVKAPGQWKGLDVRGGASTNTVLENCVVEYAGSAAGNFFGNIVVDNAPSVLITNCTIRNASGNGMTIYGSDPRVWGCTFASNTNFALAMRTDSLPTLRSNTGSGNGKDAIGVFGGGIARSGTWTKDNIPYRAYEDVFVQNTLTMEPGVTVQFQELGNGWFVDGTLIARGTAANPILFTSDETNKAPGQWKGIDVRSGASTNTVLENCVVEYAGSAAGNFFGNIVVDNAPSVLITNCTIRNASGNGMTIYGSDPRVWGCTFASNTNFALAMRTDSLPTLRSNTGSGNGKDAIGVFGGGISRSGTWTKDNIPYRAYEDVAVNGGVTLTLEPGVTVQSQELGNGWYVDGTLIARGMAANPILFTSDETNKAPGQWKGMDIRSGTTTNTVLENCTIEYAGSAAGNFLGNMIIDSAPSVLITNCTIRNASGNGMTIYNSDPRVWGCTFASNTNFALAMRADSLPTLRSNTASGNGKNAIGVFGGGISRSGTWTKDNIPYRAYEDVAVNGGVTLTIEPGVTIQFQELGTGWFVDGTLIARGMAANPILFTSDETNKAAGQWKGMDFRSTAGASTILENCIVECAASAAGGWTWNILFDSAPPILLTNCTVRASLADGIYCSVSSPWITSCRILNNGRDGVRTVNGSSPIVTNNAISVSTGFGINNLDTSRIVNGQRNYWGHSSGPFDNLDTDGQHLMNTNGLGDKVSEYVNWSPFLSADPTIGDIDVTPTNLNFGNVFVGQTNSLMLSVSNLGPATLVITSITSSNALFSVAAPATPLSIAAANRQLITVSLTPNGVGTQTGQVSIASDDPDEATVNVPLTGTGVLPVLAVSSSGNQVILSWPDSATSYSLQCVTNLPAAANSWLAVTNTPVVGGGRYNVTNNVSAARKFYRLIR